MPRPIIIIPERHTDEEPNVFLAQALPMLRERGYDTLCFEFPSDNSQEEILKGVEDTIEFFKKREAESVEYLKKKHIDHPNLRTMNYSDLDRLLLQYVSTKYSNDAKSKISTNDRFKAAKNTRTKLFSVCGQLLEVSKEVDKLKWKTKNYMKK